MADDHEPDFQTTDSGASDTYPQQCSALRKNGHVMIKGHACKIVDMSTSKTGKHGHAKVHLVGIEIFDGKKYEDICPSTHNMNVPHVSRKEYPLMDIDDGYLSLMLDSGDAKDDLKVTDEISDALKDVDERDYADYIVTVISAVGIEKPISIKKASK